MLENLLANNRAWAAGKVSDDGEYFRRHEGQQSPAYLWIGCADSRVPANQIVGLGPGELFVHRNIANQASPKDTSCRSVLQYAVGVLKVSHVLVVGHYGCGGVAAAVAGGTEGPIDGWLDPIREVHSNYRDELDLIKDQSARLDRLCELNVIQQVRNVAADDFVQAAWAQNQPLSVHGLIYSLATGLLTDLDVTVSSASAAGKLG